MASLSIHPLRANPRVLVTAAGLAILEPVWVQALALLLRDPALAGGAWAGPLSGCSVLCAALAAFTVTWPQPQRWGAMLGALAAATSGLWLYDARWLGPSFALWPAGLAGLVGARRLYRRLPDALSRWRAVPPRRAVLWGVIALLAVVQVSRLATWFGDPGSDWFLSTRHPFWAKHECLPAYVHGAELALRGEGNVYDAAHYPGLNPEAQPQTALAHMTVEDPFQYPPPFLLAPAAVLQLSQDYPAIRGMWFALQTTAFLAVAVLLAVWVGGAAGRWALWLLPLALSAFPLLHNLQYGQFHLAAIMLSVAAMWTLARGRNALGGLLLAAAVVGKVFPGVLCVWLLGRRRFAALGWTGAFCLGLSAVAYGVFGGAVFEAFVGHHLPRLSSGAAFAFGDAWPELADFVIAANQGVYGFLLKLEALGVPGIDRDMAAWINRLFAVLVGCAAWLTGRRSAEADRAQQALGWFALLGLASQVSTGAFADYVPLTATWALTLLAPRMARRGPAWGLTVIWVLQYTLAFTIPLGDWFDPRVMRIGSAVSALALLGLWLWILRPSLAAVRDRAAAAGSGEASRAVGQPWPPPAY